MHDCSECPFFSEGYGLCRRDTVIRSNRSRLATSTWSQHATSSAFSTASATQCGSLTSILEFIRCQVALKSRVIVTDLVSRERKAIGNVRLSVCLLPLYLLNRLTFELCLDHDHSSSGIESQGHGSRSKVNVQRLWAW